jgi:hypothetical protein
MKLSLFLTIGAILAFVFGLSFLLMPVQTMAMYGVDLDASGLFLGRYLGSAFLGIAVLVWLSRNADMSNAVLRAILLGNFIMAVSGFVVALLDVFTGIGNALVWSTVAIYLFLACGNGYFLFVKK